MYKIISSFWTKPTIARSSNQPVKSSDLSIDEESWVFVSNSAQTTVKHNNLMINSWIEPGNSAKNNESSATVHHFNPIENLLIEHASMSVYEQIAPKIRTRRQKKHLNDKKLDEQIEAADEFGDDDDNNDKTSMNHHGSNLTSIYQPNLSIPSITNTEITNMTAHHRHLQRLHQRRKRANKPTSKLLLTNSIDESKEIFDENIELEHTNSTRMPNIPYQQSSHAHDL